MRKNLNKWVNNHLNMLGLQIRLNNKEIEASQLMLVSKKLY